MPLHSHTFYPYGLTENVKPRTVKLVLLNLISTIEFHGANVMIRTDRSLNTSRSARRRTCASPHNDIPNLSHSLPAMPDSKGFGHHSTDPCQLLKSFLALAQMHSPEAYLLSVQKAASQLCLPCSR